MKNQKILIFAIVTVLIVILGGGYFVLSSKKETPKPADTQVEAQPSEETVNILKPEDIGLTLSVTPDKKRVIMEITNLKDLSSLDYELSYTSKENIPRGAIGNIEVSPKDKMIKKEIVLGTCSDVCHYDQEISDIKLVVKVTKLDNKVYSVEKSLEL